MFLIARRRSPKTCQMITSEMNRKWHEDIPFHMSILKNQGPKVPKVMRPQCFLSTTSMSQKNDGRTHRAKFGRRSLPTLNVANESQCVLSGTILRSFYHSFFANRLSAKRLGMFLNLTALPLRFLRKKPKLRV